MKFSVAACAFASAVATASASSLRVRADPYNCSSYAAAGAFQPVTLVSPNNDLQLSFIPYGAVVTNIKTADKNGNTVDIVLGFDDKSQYCANSQHPYFGALIGRVANRIANGTFTLDGNVYNTPINEVHSDGSRGDTLHGGTIGFDRHQWSVSQINASCAALSIISPDGDMGFPGQLDVTVRYCLTADRAWQLDYSAFAHADTVIGLTQHTYWNLNAAQALITEHVLQMQDGTTFIDVDKNLIPTGAFDAVTAYPWMDFTTAKAIGRDIRNGTVSPNGGYDDAWIMAGWKEGQAPVKRLTVSSPLSGIGMDVYTDQPSIQFYSGNFLNGSIPKKADQGDGFYEMWSAIALEAQHFPDSVHHQGDPAWPNVVLKAGTTYTQTTKYAIYNV